MDIKRSSGILLPLFSLPSKHGIGDMGPSAYKFIDQLVLYKQSLWQMLPFSIGDGSGCPYSSYSAFGGYPLLISPDLLLEEGLLSPKDLSDHDNLPHHYVNYEMVEEYKTIIFQKAFCQFLNNKKMIIEFDKFKCANHHWLPDLSLFIVLTEQFGHKWVIWPEEYKYRYPEALNAFIAKNKEQITYHSFLQFIFFKQWDKLKNYANQKGIKLIGDIPIFVKHHSMDVWTRPDQFKLDHNGYPYVVTGAPPDEFSEVGQNWGNPNYNWDYMIRHNFDWWISRLQFMHKYFDIIRLDHFRGFAGTWEIPAHIPDARAGHWIHVPGDYLFKQVREKLGNILFIAEDLGTITNDVHWLRDKYGFLGMKVLQFAFGKGDTNHHLPHNSSPNTVVYTGTHDNQTTKGWINSLGNTLEKDFTFKYCNAWNIDNFHWSLINLALASPCKLAIIPLQDIMGLDNHARINTPGLEKGNWMWRFTWENLAPQNLTHLMELTAKHNR